MGTEARLRLARGRGATRLWHGPHLVSEARASEGATDSVFDVLAACAQVLAPQASRMAVLGFAAGGLMAPLRALGCTALVEGVDLSLTGEKLFRRVAHAYAGQFRVWQDDAAGWLRDRGHYDVVIEDLSAQTPGDVVKPEVSWTALPQLIAQHVVPHGAVVVNVLPTPGHSRRAFVKELLAPWPEVRVCELHEYENLIAMGGHALPPAQQLGHQVRAHLTAIGSTLAHGLRVRTQL